MPQAIAVPIFNFVSTLALKLGANVVIAAKLGHLAVTVASIAAKTIITAVLTKAISKGSRPLDQGSFLNLGILPDAPRTLQVGKRMVAGNLVDWYLEGTKNDRIYMIIYLGEGPMGTCTRLFGGGREVYASSLAHGVRTAIPNYRGNGTDLLWITYYDGRVGQTANSYLVSRGLGWTNNHIGTGCAYAIVEAKYSQEHMPQPPYDLLFEIEGAHLYDRRLDSTSGGSGSHQHDDPDTWAVSDNPEVALDHYLRGRYLGSVKTFGIGLDDVDVPYARHEAQANLCDEDVALKAGGTQKRYRANGFLSAERDYASTIKDLCRAMNARPADFGGRIGILDGESRTPVMTLTDDDVIDGAQEQYKPKRSWSALVSEVFGNYQNPGANYQSVEYKAVTDAAWVAEDGGETRPMQVDFEMETDHERAQRLAWLRAKRERRQAQLTGTYSLKAIELEQGDWFTRSGGRFGAGKTFEVINRILDPETFTVTLAAFEVDPADSAWASSIARDPDPDPIPNTSIIAPLEVPNLTSVVALDLSGSAATVQSINVIWDVPTDPRVNDIVVEVLNPGGNTVASSGDPSTGRMLMVGGILDNVIYQVRARFKSPDAVSAWSTVFQVTTGGVWSAGSASAVPWSQVTDDGNRPDDNADVTGSNTAAAIAGQGWGATASEADASNQIPPNLIPNGAMELDGEGWTFFKGGFVENDNSRYYQGVADASGTIVLAYSPATAVVAGRVYSASAEFSNTFDGSGDQVRLDILFFNSSGAVVGSSGDTIANQTNFDEDRAKNEAHTAPAGAVSAVVRTYLVNAVSGVTVARMRRVKLERGSVSTAYISAPSTTERLATVEDNADVTGSNTAAAISGQGSLATANRASRRRVTTTISGNGGFHPDGVSDVYHTAASLSIPTTSTGIVELVFRVEFEAANAQNMTNYPYQTFVAQIQRNGVTIADNIFVARILGDTSVSNTADPVNGVTVWAVDDAPLSATPTYTLRFKCSDANPKSPSDYCAAIRQGVGEFFRVVAYESDANDVA